MTNNPTCINLDSPTRERSSSIDLTAGSQVGKEIDLTDGTCGSIAGSSGAAGSSVGGSKGTAIELDDSEGEQMIGNDDECRAVTATEAGAAAPKRCFSQLIDDDLEVTGSAGRTLVANLPHSRNLCPLHTFEASQAKRARATNVVSCESCW